MCLKLQQLLIKINDDTRITAIINFDDKDVSTDDSNHHNKQLLEGRNQAATKKNCWWGKTVILHLGFLFDDLLGNTGVLNRTSLLCLQ